MQITDTTTLFNDVTTLDGDDPAGPLESASSDKADHDRQAVRQFPSRGTRRFGWWLVVLDCLVSGEVAVQDQPRLGDECRLGERFVDERHAGFEAAL